MHNETTVFIPDDMEMHIGGSLLNTGFFQNNGSVALSGNWINTLVYQGSGVVLLEGTDQRIDNNRQAMDHLVLNGGGTKTVQGLLTITGRLDFHDGIIVVSDADTLVLDEQCIVNTGSASSYVDGALIAIGSGYKVFPIGKNGKYQPVTLEDSRGIALVQQVEVFENLPDIQTNSPTTAKRDVYWERKTISGFFEGSPINFGYNLQSTDLTRLVILEGNSMDDLFTVNDGVEFSTAADPHSTNSVRFLTKTIFALGELILDPPKKYYLSTTLSPNAANPDNRRVKVFGDTVTPIDFSFQVFNRWGLLIFESTSYETMATQGWEGKQHGNVLVSGVYPYSLKYIDTAGRYSTQTGFITIIH